LGVYCGLSQTDTGNTLDVDDSFYIIVHACYQVLPRLNFHMRKNINNEKTLDAFSFDHPGAAVYGGVIWKL
jgi:hypothetical protein